MKIRWTNSALAGLEEIHSYIAKDSRESANKVITQIEEAAYTLESFPELGRIGRIIGTREFIITGTPYMIIYRIKGSMIELLSILHSSLPYPKLFEI